jgi:hypothetical protein
MGRRAAWDTAAEERLFLLAGLPFVDLGMPRLRRAGALVEAWEDGL